MRRFQNTKDIENPLKTSLFTKENPHFGPPKNGFKKIEKPKIIFSKKQKKYLEIILKYTLCQIFVKIGWKLRPLGLRTTTTTTTTDRLFPTPISTHYTSTHYTTL